MKILSHKDDSYLFHGNFLECHEWAKEHFPPVPGELTGYYKLSDNWGIDLTIGEDHASEN